MSTTLGKVAKQMRAAGFYSLPGVVERAAEFIEQAEAHSAFTAPTPLLSGGKDGTLSLIFHLTTRRDVKGESKKVATIVRVSCEALMENPSKAAARCIAEANEAVENLVNEAA